MLPKYADRKGTKGVLAPVLLLQVQRSEEGSLESGGPCAFRLPGAHPELLQHRHVLPEPLKSAITDAVWLRTLGRPIRIGFAGVHRCSRVQERI